MRLPAPKQLPRGIFHFTRSEIDMQELKSFCDEWAGPEGFWTFDQIVHSFLQPGVGALIAREIKDARESEDPAAFLLFQVVPGSADLLYVFVRKIMRKKGLGAHILKAWLDWMRELDDCDRVFLEVRESNVSAQKLYEAVGFYQSGIRKSYYSNGDSAVVYRYDLHMTEQ